MKHVIFLSVAFSLLFSSLLFCGKNVSLGQTVVNSAAEPLDSAKYPQLKFGFTTQNFVKSLPVTFENVVRLLDFAAEQGFTWVEIRDPDADLTVDECKELSTLAEQRGLEIAYAIQRTFLADDFWPVFNRGVANAKVFHHGPRTIRACVAIDVYKADAEKPGLTEEEYDHVVTTAKKAAAFAKEHGLQLVVENVYEPLTGKIGEYYGMTELLAALRDEVRWQADSGNFFQTMRGPDDPEKIMQFFKHHQSLMSYLHLKAARDGQTLPYLADSPLDFHQLFALLAQTKTPYVAVELLVSDEDTFDSVRRNTLDSLAYLREIGALRQSPDKK